MICLSLSLYTYIYTYIYIYIYIMYNDIVHIYIYIYISLRRIDAIFGTRLLGTHVAVPQCHALGSDETASGHLFVGAVLGDSAF